MLATEHNPAAGLGQRYLDWTYFNLNQFQDAHDEVKKEDPPDEEPFIPCGNYHPHPGRWVDFQLNPESEVTKIYVPNQQDFHLARWDHTFRGVITGYGAGKTTCGIGEVLYWALGIPEKIGGHTVGWMGEPTFQMVEDVLIPTLESNAFLGCKIDESEWVRRVKRSGGYVRKIEWINGSVTNVGSFEIPERIEGGNWDYAYPDEMSGARRFKDLWRIMSSRLRGSGQLKRPVPHRAWTTSLPLPRGTPMWDFFANPVTMHPSSKVFHWTQMDNPDLSKQYLDDQKHLHQTEQDNILYRLGEWLNIGVGSYRYDYAVHYFEDYSILPPRHLWKSVGYALDFGWDHFLAFEVAVLDSIGRAFFVDEIYEQELEAEDLMKRIRILQKKWQPDEFKNRRTSPVWCDHESRTIAYLRKYGIDARKAQKTQEARNAGIREMGGRFNVKKDGQPRIKIHKNCNGMLREVVMYDSTKKIDDDAMDSARYLLYHNMPGGNATYATANMKKNHDTLNKYKLRKVA